MTSEIYVSAITCTNHFSGFRWKSWTTQGRHFAFSFFEVNLDTNTYKENRIHRQTDCRRVLINAHDRDVLFFFFL